MRTNHLPALRNYAWSLPFIIGFGVIAVCGYFGFGAYKQFRSLERKIEYSFAENRSAQSLARSLIDMRTLVWVFETTESPQAASDFANRIGDLKRQERLLAATTAHDPEEAAAVGQLLREIDGWVGQVQVEMRSGRRFPPLRIADVAGLFGHFMIGLRNLQTVPQRRSADEIVAIGYRAKEAAVVIGSLLAIGLLGWIRWAVSAWQNALERQWIVGLLQYSPHDIYFKDRSGRYVLASASVASKFGVPDARELRGKTDFDFFSAEYAVQSYDDEQQLMETGKPLVGKQELQIFPDGSTRWVLTTKIAIRNPAGHEVGLFGITRDFTEIREAQEALRQSEIRFRSLVEDAPVAIGLLDMNSMHLIEANRALMDLLGVTSAAEALGLDVGRDVLVHAELLDTLRATIPKPFHVETLIRRRNGEVVRVALTGKHVEAGAPQLYECIAVDITERRKAELELRQAVRMQTDFVSFVSHQLRTPLAGIKWMLELARDADISDEAASYLEDAHASADRLVLLVHDLLNISRLESGRIGGSPVRVNMPELCREVLAEHAMLINSREQKLLFHAGPQFMTVMADRQLLKQAIANLVSNAIKYTPKQGGIEIRLFAEAEQAVLLVADTGIGVPESEISRLFTKFFRAQNANSMAAEGSGLGLYIVRLIAERYGGAVSCERRSEGGSVFSLRLPLADHHEHEEPEAGGLTPHHEETHTTGGR
jgi:PAS domain S-box-containing protein